MPSVLDQLHARVQRALARFPELLRAIPDAELRSPAHLRAWISAAAALDKKGAQRASFGELSEAVEKWQAAAGLVELRHEILILDHEFKRVSVRLQSGDGA